MVKALLLDRDGVINKDKYYLHRYSDVEYVEGIFDLIKRFGQNGYKIFVITNQSGIGRGYYSDQDVADLHLRMNKDILRFTSFAIDDWFYCPHTDTDGCTCRKPAMGLIDKVVRLHNIDKSASVLIGDKPSDIQAGISAQIHHRYLLQSEYFKLEEVKYLQCVKANSIAEIHSHTLKYVIKIEGSTS
jgi:D-glycero-D-manno-heptose 1,7-bisphosphate phosphatase